MRAIDQNDTPASFGAEPNPTFYVYHTSGPYTDPDVDIDLRRGLEPIRASWIEARADTKTLDGPSARFAAERLADPELDPVRFPDPRRPRRGYPFGRS